MDDFDYELLKTLHKLDDCTIIQLTKLLNATRQRLWRRLKKLVENGYIKKVCKYDLNMEKIKQEPILKEIIK